MVLFEQQQQQQQQQQQRQQQHTNFVQRPTHPYEHYTQADIYLNMYQH